MNNVFNLLNGNSMISRFHEFERTFRGDPRAEVQRRMQTGQISQEQFNQVAQKANELYSMIYGK